MSGILNLITDVPGLAVAMRGTRLASGVTVVVFDEPAVASLAIHGGAPGVRDTALLEPEMTVERIDALALSAARPLGSTRWAACSRRCGSRGAASRSATRACRSFRARSCSICSMAATRTGAQAPLLGAGLRGRDQRRTHVRVWRRRRGPRRQYRQSEGRPGLRQRVHVQRLSRRGHCRGQRPGQRQSATVRIFGPRRSNAAPSLAASAGRRPRRVRRSICGCKPIVWNTRPSPSSPPTRR